MENVFSRICSLKRAINDICRLNGMEPVFHPSSETETIANKLSTFSCTTQDDFSEFVTMVYKFIIESSGDSGERLPKAPCIDSMKAHIKELRNHFLHVREYGKPTDARSKFIKVGEIYQVLIGKRAPEEKDWLLVQNALLNEIQIGLEQVAASPSIRNPQNEETGAAWTKKYEDNNVFIFGCKPSQSRTTNKRGYLSHLSDIPVFLPDFTLVPPPHIGNTENVVYITSSTYTGTVDNFAKCVHELEQMWLKNDFLLSSYSPFSWSIAQDNGFRYGFGSSNLIKEIRNTIRGSIGAIMQGCFGEHYDRTCFLVLHGYRKGEHIDVGIALYLSCIPTNLEWFEKLFSAAFHHFGARDIKINFYSIEPMCFLEWKNIGQMIKLKILGGIRREGFGLSKENRETDSYTGVIIENSNIPLSGYRLDRSWNLDFIKDNFEIPLKLLDESVISITNPIPYCDEVESGKISVCAPHIIMFIFDGFGANIFGIAIHSTGPKFK